MALKDPYNPFSSPAGYEMNPDYDNDDQNNTQRFFGNNPWERMGGSDDDEVINWDALESDFGDDDITKNVEEFRKKIADFKISDKFSDELGKDQTGTPEKKGFLKGEFGKSLGKAGIAALQVAPSMYATLKDKPRNKKQVIGQTLSTAGNMAKIGQAFGPLGAIGFGLAGLGLGLANSKGMYKRELRRADKSAWAKEADAVKRRYEDFYAQTSKGQAEAYNKILSNAYGYQT